MKILLINHYAGSPKHGMEFRPYYLAREWVKAGHEVHVIAAGYSHIRQFQPVFNSCSYFCENIDGIYYHWYKTPKYVGNGIGRVVNIFCFIFMIFFDAVKVCKAIAPDIVIASSTYPLDIFPAKLISKITNAKLIFEVHDLWPLSPIELGGISRLHPFMMMLQFAENYAYKCSDKVVSMLPNTLDHMVSHGLSVEKWNYIPNGVDLEAWNSSDLLPSEIQDQMNVAKESGVAIVGYAGTYGLANALDVLLDAAHLLQGCAHIIMVGTGPEREYLISRVAKERLQNVSIFNSVPKDSIPSFLKQIDVAYIGWHDNPLYRFGISPNKLMDYMMAGNVVVHSVRASNDPVLESGCGISVPPNDHKLVADAILELLALDVDQRKYMGELGRSYIMRNRIYKVLANDFMLLMKSN